MLLTTHYLEEAEALCGRIAMLKQGRVVALDRTANLLAGTAQHDAALQDRRRAAADARRAARASPGASRRSTAHDAAEVEALLGALRGAGVRIEDLEIGRADLEDVFLEIMHGGRRAVTRWRHASRHDRRRARCSTRRCCASGR